MKAAISVPFLSLQSEDLIRYSDVVIWRKEKYEKFFKVSYIICTALLEHQKRTHRFHGKMRAEGAQRTWMGMWWRTTGSISSRRIVPLAVAIPKPRTALRCCRRCCCCSVSRPENYKISAAAASKRRILTLSLTSYLCFSSPFQQFHLPFAAAVDERQLERYTDTKEGFTLLIPSSWIKVEKAGATALFEDGKGDNVGIVVTPVRLNSLPDFGTPQFVADKLIQAEKRKESTNDAEVVGVAERLGNGGLPVYEFEYKLDSTRGGMKRIFSAAFVASKKLYLLNIAYADRQENPIDGQTRSMLEQVLHSFDVGS